MSVAEGHGMASNQRRWAEWEARMARWRTSGTSIRQRCLDEGVCEPSFYQWRKRVLRAGSQFDDRCQSETPRSRRGAARVPGLSLGRAKLYEIEKMIKRELVQSETAMSTEDDYRFIASRRQKLAVPVLTEFRK
jgi:hypothetical protein